MLKQIVRIVVTFCEVFEFVSFVSSVSFLISSVVVRVAS
jgi:hypothetical protein